MCLSQVCALIALSGFRTLLTFSVTSWYECCSAELLIVEASAYCVCRIYQWYITIIIAFLEVVQLPEHHITYCSVLQEHVHCFAALEFFLYLCRWNWLFIKSLLELRCFISTRMTSTGAAPLAGKAPLSTLFCELLTMPSIILYLGKRFLVLQGHLQVDQQTKDQLPWWIPWWSGKIFIAYSEISAHDCSTPRMWLLLWSPWLKQSEELYVKHNTITVHILVLMPCNKSPPCFIQYRSLSGRHLWVCSWYIGIAKVSLLYAICSA